MDCWILPIVKYSFSNFAGQEKIYFIRVGDIFYSGTLSLPSRNYYCCFFILVFYQSVFQSDFKTVALVPHTIIIICIMVEGHAAPRFKFLKRN